MCVASAFTIATGKGSTLVTATKTAGGIRQITPQSPSLQRLATSRELARVATHCALSETRGHVSILSRSTCQTGPMQPHSQAAYTLMPSSMPSDVAASPQLSRVVGKVHRFATPGPADHRLLRRCPRGGGSAHNRLYDLSRAIQKSGLFQLTLMCEGYAKASSIRTCCLEVHTVDERTKSNKVKYTEAVKPYGSSNT